MEVESSCDSPHECLSQEVAYESRNHIKEEFENQPRITSIKAISSSGRVEENNNVEIDSNVFKKPLTTVSESARLLSEKAKKVAAPKGSPAAALQALFRPEIESNAISSEDLFIEKTPGHLLVEKTPEGHRRIKGQKTCLTSVINPDANNNQPNRPMEDVKCSYLTSKITSIQENIVNQANNNIHSMKVEQCSYDGAGDRPTVSVVKNERSSYIPYPSPKSEDLKEASVTLSDESTQNSKSPCITPVELQVTNLDQTVEQREMKKIITTLFKEHVSVLHVSVFFQSDGNMAACVRVPSLQDAQYAISQLHRKKVGYKRILISHSIHNGNSQNNSLIRSKVASILSEVPQGCLHLFKFREMFEKRYHDSIGVSDLYKMKDLVTISDDTDGRMVQLNSFNGRPMHSNIMSNNAMNTSIESHFHSAPGFSYESSCGIANMAHFTKNGHMSSLVRHNLVNSLPNSGSNSSVILDTAFCHLHCSQDGDGKGWAERENGTLLPNVIISLSVLGPNVIELIGLHDGGEFMPLASLDKCYTSVFGIDSLPIDVENGVPLEHLVSCIRGVQIAQAPSGVKRLIRVPANLNSSINLTLQPNCSGQDGNMYFNGSSHVISSNTLGEPNSQYSLYKSPSLSASSSMTNLTQIGSAMGSSVFAGTSVSSAAAPLAGQLSLFSRELVDLIKNSPGCRMPFHKFIPSYHHHFGRQCRVADYGYTKLKDLFEALPHVVQILGEGSRAIITLSHRAQVKRFTSDLLRVLKSQANKQICLSEVPAIFEKTLNNAKFKISDYGVCDIEDILIEVSETSVVLSYEGDDVYIAIPKREQTQDEMERTHQFANECIELLRHAPDCRLSFNKFIPAYHHHFGRQCRVADYGFTKLIELFEAIPFTVEITEDADGERLLQLTDSQRLEVLGAQVVFLIRNSTHSSKPIMPLRKLEELYRIHYGYPLRPDNYGESKVEDVLSKLTQVMRVEYETDNDTMSDVNDIQIRLIDRSYIRALGQQVKSILAGRWDGKMELDEFIKIFKGRYDKVLDVEQIKTDLSDLIIIQDECVDESDKENMKSNQSDSNKIDQNDITEGVQCMELGDGNDKNNEFDCEDVKAFIILTPIQLCSIKIQKLLEDHKDKILCSEFENAFVEKYDTPLCPGQYGHPSLNSLIRALPEYFAIKGRGTRKMIWYLRDGHSKHNIISNIYNAPHFNKSMSFYEGGISGAVVSSTANYLASLSNPRYTGHGMNSSTMKSKSNMHLGSSFCSPSHASKQFSFKTPDQSKNYSRQKMNTGPNHSITHNSVGPVRYSTARYEGFKMFPPTQTTPKRPTRVFYHGASNGGNVPKFTFSTPQANGIGSSSANHTRNMSHQPWANQYCSRFSKPMLNEPLRASSGCNVSPMHTGYGGMHHTPVHASSFSYGSNGHSSEWNGQHQYQHTGNFANNSPNLTPIRDTSSSKQRFTYPHPPPNYSGMRNHPVNQLSTLSPGIWTNQHEMNLPENLASMLPIPHSPSPLLHPTPGAMPHQSGANVSNNSFVFPPTNQQEMDLAQFGIYASTANTQTRNTMQHSQGTFFN